MKKFWYLFSMGIIICSSAAGQQIPGGVRIQPRIRVISDNDFSGDPDGLFQLAHLLLSPSVDIRGIIGTHLRKGDPFDPSETQATNAAKKAKELMDVMGMQQNIPVLTGSNVAMPNDSTPARSDGIDFIIREARRTDTKQPLYVLCGAGLTEIASALLKAPDIAGRLTLIWIGGQEYTDLAPPPPNYSSPEYNLNIDIAAAQAVFNRTQVPIWQVPRNMYRQAILPYSQLVLNVKPHGKTGEYLTNVFEQLMTRIQGILNIGETYIMGDSPLVLLTALQSSFEADPSSSFYIVRQSPAINDRGDYIYNHRGRPIRVYTDLDIHLMFNDFFAKLALHYR
ncbi:nucleoside hydrolase [Pollutibacter soli]|uniref:nucleoside hydrolase n=1 Tax=Pollutibacter soli TaxID=3034157 RepID=UPI0030141BEF